MFHHEMLVLHLYLIWSQTVKDYQKKISANNFFFTFFYRQFFIYGKNICREIHLLSIHLEMANMIVDKFRFYREKRDSFLRQLFLLAGQKPKILNRWTLPWSFSSVFISLKIGRKFGTVTIWKFWRTFTTKILALG